MRDEYFYNQVRTSDEPIDGALDFPNLDVVRTSEVRCGGQATAEDVGAEHLFGGGGEGRNYCRMRRALGSNL